MSVVLTCLKMGENEIDSRCGKESLIRCIIMEWEYIEDEMLEQVVKFHISM